MGFPPKRPGMAIGAPKSMKDIRLGVAHASAGPSDGGSSSFTCPACGESLKASVDKGGLPDNDGDESPEGGSGGSDAIDTGGGGGY